MLKIVVCDDEHSVFEQLKEHILRYSVERNIDIDHRILHYASAAELLNAKHDYNILFLDIMLGDGLNGIEVGKQLREMGNTAMFVMVTSREDLALKGYEATVFRYLVKPVNQNDIFETLDAAIKAMEYDKDIVEIKFGQERRYINVKNILYVESYDRKRYLVTNTDKYTISAKSEALINQLSSLSYFFSPRKSHLVNLAHIIAISSTELTMRNGEKIIFARGKHKEFLIEFSDFFKLRM